MKIQINYLTSFRRYSIIGSSVLALISLVLLGQTVLKTAQFVTAQDEIPLLEKQITRLNEITAKTQTIKMPPRDEMERLRTHLRNNIPNAGDANAPVWLLDQLGRILPKKVGIKSIQYKVKDQVINLVAQSRDAQALTKLLARLEQQTKFFDVVLRKQSQVKQAGRSQLRFEIGLKVRS